MAKDALSANQRIGMSLEDVIKNQAQAQAKRRRSKANSAPAGAQKPKQNNNAKVAKSVGAASAKRAANVDKRRGLNASGKATKAAVQGAILRAGQKKRPSSATSNVSGLKISFKPKELKQTTEKLVAQQINAVLAKQPAKNNNNNNNSKPSTPNPPKKRSVIVTPRSAGSNRGNPKRRNSNGSNGSGNARRNGNKKQPAIKLA